jgi:hypothetical protein
MMNPTHAVPDDSHMPQTGGPGPRTAAWRTAGSRTAEQDSAATEDPAVAEDPAATEDPAVAEDPAATEDPVISEVPAVAENPDAAILAQPGQDAAQFPAELAAESPAERTVPDPVADPAAGTAGPEPAAGTVRESFASTSPAPHLDERWHEILMMFVDDPRGSVERAADLASDTLRELSHLLQERESSMRSAWQGAGTDTEELRTSLRSYRALVDQVAEFTKQP